MRGLPPDDAAAHGLVDLLGQAGPHHPAGVRPDVDGAQRAEPAGGDDAPGLLDEGAGALGLPAGEELDAAALHGLQHSLALLHGDAHGLAEHHVLAVPGGGDGVLCMELVGRGDPDGLHAGVGAEVFDGVVGAAAEAPPEGVEGLGAQIGGGNDVDLVQAL